MLKSSTKRAPQPALRRQLSDERRAQLGEHQATAQLWGFDANEDPVVPIPTLTARGRVARRGGWVWLVVGCTVSGVFSAATMNFGGVFLSFAAGVLIALALSAIVRTALRSLLDAHQENPDAIESLRKILAVAIAAIVAGAVLPLALRFVAIDVPDWWILVSVGLAEVGCLAAGATLELEGHMLLWSDRLIRQVRNLDARIARFDKLAAFRAALTRPLDSTDVPEGSALHLEETIPALYEGGRRS